MNPWRFIRASHAASAAAGALQHGVRRTSTRLQSINLLFGPGLATCAALRFPPGDLAWVSDDCLPDWAGETARPERLPVIDRSQGRGGIGDDGLLLLRSLLVAVQFAVLPGIKIAMMNRSHPHFASVARLTARLCRFEDYPPVPEPRE